MSSNLLQRLKNGIGDLTEEEKDAIEAAAALIAEECNMKDTNSNNDES